MSHNCESRLFYAPLTMICMRIFEEGGERGHLRQINALGAPFLLFTFRREEIDQTP